MPVSVLNGMLTDQCINAKGNKIQKILTLVSSVKPKKLHELVTGCTGVENVGKAKAAPKAKAKAMANKNALTRANRMRRKSMMNLFPP